MKARWVALAVGSLVAVAALVLVATQLQLSRGKEVPCGTALRIDLRTPTLLLDRATEVERAGASGLVSEADASRQAEDFRATAKSLADRCKTRQTLALIVLGGGGVAVASAVAWCTHRLGRRAGEALTGPGR